MNAKVTTLTSKCWRRLINPRKRHGPFNVKCGSIPIGACIRRPGCVTAPALVAGNPASPLHDAPTIRYTRLLQLTNLVIHDSAYRDVENASYAMINGVRGETNLIIKSWRMVSMTCRKSQFSFRNFSVTHSCLTYREYLPSFNILLWWKRPCGNCAVTLNFIYSSILNLFSYAFSQTYY